MRISAWCSDVCSADLTPAVSERPPEPRITSFSSAIVGVSPTVSRLGRDSESWDRPSGFHTPRRRGFTHPTIGGSHTESRGFTHRAVLQALENMSKKSLFERLNLLNDSFLTESFNGDRKRVV